MRRLLAAATAIAALMTAATVPSAEAQTNGVKISQLPNEPTTTIPLADAFAAQSTNCINTYGDCRVSMQQIVATVLANMSSTGQGVTNSNPPAFHGDYALFTSQIGSTTGGQVYADAIGNCGSGCTAADALRGVAIATSGSTTASVNAVAAYLLNQNANANNGGNGVGLFSTVISAVDGAQSWGVNLNVEDSILPWTVSNGANRQLLNEFDFNVTSPNTLVNGLVLQGASVSKPLIANAVVVGNLSLGYMNGDAGAVSVPWDAGFVTEPSAAVYGLQLGLRGAKSGANLSSQYIGLESTDASGTSSYAFIDGTPNGIEVSNTLIPHYDTGQSFGGFNNKWLEMWTQKVVLQPLTAGSLPPCNYYTSGALATVTDSQNTNTYTYVQGGGPYHVLVMCDSNSWVVH